MSNSNNLDTIWRYLINAKLCTPLSKFAQNQEIQEILDSFSNIHQKAHYCLHHIAHLLEKL